MKSLPLKKFSKSFWAFLACALLGATLLFINLSGQSDGASGKTFGIFLYGLQVILAVSVVVFLVHFVMQKILFPLSLKKGEPAQALFIRARMPLDGRTTLYLVQVEQNRILVGVSQAGVQFLTLSKEQANAKGTEPELMS